ncbi:PEP-CTERM sorting domain-containing protein [Massilia agilis]|uniref:PEP-CTERM sorting domain-containing protein n=1 Tax=Massilia agilis TaxID=1811226 RepID=A0ABT2D6X8_9BURK|nr:PEP-CTERM sorting domain-containing protein [Massilia agilis]MCS0807069.1 PEP-CTERM sorting domain-containing protein [Massilia agilis]
MIPRKPFLAAALALLAAAPLAAFADPQYTVTFVPPGFEPGPFDPMNNAGRVVGTYQNRAAIWDGSGLLTLNVPPGTGSGINDHLDVTGRVFSTNTAYALIGGNYVDIHATLPSLYYTSEGYSINNRGSVAGIADPFVDEAVRGFLYRNGHSELVPTLGGDFSFALNVNNHDAVVGYASNGQGSVNDPFYHAIIYQDGTVQDLGTLGTGERSLGYDINDCGQAVGWSSIGPDDSAIHPFLFQDGKMIDLGTLGSGYGQAHAINNLGLIVGESGATVESPLTAFLYIDHKMIDLNAITTLPAGWHLATASDINDQGQILAIACNGPNSEDCTSVRLDLVSAVPEPSAAALLAAGLALVACRRRRVRRARA